MGDSTLVTVIEHRRIEYKVPIKFTSTNQSEVLEKLNEGFYNIESVVTLSADVVNFENVD